MNINLVWQDIVRNILKQDMVRLPRGMVTKEILNYNSTIDMNFPFLNIWQREIGTAFRYAEAAWILSGDNRVKTISPYSKMISQFSDDGIRFFGSYGPKVVDQLSYVIDTLNKDDYSRQAVINICVVTGLFPVTGIPLTFISYGGTSLLSSMFCVGVLVRLGMKS